MITLAVLGLLAGLFVGSLAWVYFRSRIRADIGTVMLRFGLIDEAKLRSAVEVQRAGRARLGEILVDMRFVTPEQMELALRVQRLMRRGHPGEAMLCVVEYRTDRMQAAARRAA